MNEEEVMRLYIKANGWSPSFGDEMDEVFRFALLLRETIIEECAKVCDGWTQADGDRCAEAIRAMEAS